jgi:hypothetical protein
VERAPIARRSDKEYPIGWPRLAARQLCFRDTVSIEPWFAQPDRVLGTAILLPGRMFGAATPLLHWPATLLTQYGWSVLHVEWDENGLTDGEASHVRQCADAALDRAAPDRPVLVVAKSLGTLALPWAVENGLPGAWLTPLLRDRTVLTAVEEAQQPTLLVGGTADPHWHIPATTGPGISITELPGADHGLQQPADWRRSLLDQVEIFDRINHLAGQVLAHR